MNNLALLFPGQGVQKSGMGKDIYENSLKARNVFETANKVLGFDVIKMCFEGSEEDLKKTIYSQPCIVTVELALFEALKESMPIDFKAVAGHSLGEYTALYASGAIDLETVLSLIGKRAELMEEAAKSTRGAMAAILGLDDEAVINLAKQMKDIFVANFNTKGQVVITGSKEEIEANLDKFKEAGAKKVVPLAVSGAFHSPFMHSAGEKFVDFVNKFEINDTNIPVYLNVTGTKETLGLKFKEELPKQIYSSVMWTKTIENMIQEKIDGFIEIGPGKVLSGLNKKINSEIVTLNVSDWETLKSTVEELREKELV